MANLLRLRVAWSGGTVVGPGVSTFHFLSSTTGVPAAIKSLFEQVRNYAPAGTSWTIPDGGETIEESTGQANGIWTQSGGGTVAAEGQPQHAAGVGGRVVWQTAGFNNGRRVKGSTFLVPMAANLYDIDGTFLPAVVIGMNSRIASVLEDLDGGMVVWSHRPGSTTGTTSVVTSGTFADKTSWLRSRRT